MAGPPSLTTATAKATARTDIAQHVGPLPRSAAGGAEHYRRPPLRLHAPAPLHGRQARKGRRRRGGRLPLPPRGILGIIRRFIRTARVLVPRRRKHDDAARQGCLRDTQRMAAGHGPGTGAPQFPPLRRRPGHLGHRHLDAADRHGLAGLPAEQFRRSCWAWPTSPHRFPRPWSCRWRAC